MKRVIIFFNLGPAEVVNMMDGVTTVGCKYPNGKEIKLQIMSAGFPSLTGDAKVVHVASDRTLSSNEIWDASNRLL